jgi:hypothetical protein
MRNDTYYGIGQARPEHGKFENRNGGKDQSSKNITENTIFIKSTTETRRHREKEYNILRILFPIYNPYFVRNILNNYVYSISLCLCGEITYFKQPVILSHLRNYHKS